MILPRSAKWISNILINDDWGQKWFIDPTLEQKRKSYTSAAKWGLNNTGNKKKKRNLKPILLLSWPILPHIGAENIFQKSNLSCNKLVKSGRILQWKLYSIRWCDIQYDPFLTFTLMGYSQRSCSMKRYYKILQHSPENTFARASFLINLQASASNFTKKVTLAQVVSREFCEIVNNTFFTKHLPMTASY